MSQWLLVNLLDHSLHLINHFMDTWLHLCVIVLNIVYKFAQAPKSICLNGKERVRIQHEYIFFRKYLITSHRLSRFRLLYELILTLFSNLLILFVLLKKHRWRQEYYNHWSSQIINSLDISACWMSHRPDKKYPDHHRLDALLTKEFNFWLCSDYINPDLLEVCILITRHIIDLFGKLFNSVLWCSIIEVMLN